MLKLIFAQLWKERKGNFLIWLELLVVSVFLWYAADVLFLHYKNYSRPVGFDISNVYYVKLGVVPAESADYDTTTVHAGQGGADFVTLCDRLGRDPRVESVCYTTNTHFHYRWNNQYAYFKDDSLTYNGFVRHVDPAYFRVFRVRAADGGSPETLVQALKEDKVVITGTVADKLFKQAADARNKEIWITDQGDRDSVSYVVGAVSEPQRYNEFNGYDYAYYKSLTTGFDIRTVNASVAENLNIFIRVKPGADNSRFAADFHKEMLPQLRLGNIYLQEVVPMSEFRDGHLRHFFDDVRLYASCILFFLMNVLLGVIGTFWFRTQQRKSEIGLRMAMGASRRSIFGLLVTEGIALLAMAFIPAVIVVANLMYLDVMQSTSKLATVAERFLVEGGFTFGLLLLMIFAGIIAPARRAMLLTPAEALRDE